MSTNTPQIQRTNHFIHKVLADFPVPGEIAANLIRERAQPFCSEELDPDNTLLTTIEYNTDNPDAPFTGAIVQSMTLTEALITNAPVAPGGLVNITEYSMTAPYFNIVPELPRLMDNRIPAVFNDEFITSGWIPPQRYEAIYLRSLPQVYGPDTQLDISPQTFRVAVQSSNFEEAYNNAILAFWDKHQENYKTLMRIAFIEAYLIQFEEFSLTVEERQLAARAAGVAVEKDFSNLTLEDMQAPYVPDAGISLRLLRIHNSEATDILTITDNQSQITLLYIPGNSSPFHGYTNPASMRAKVVSVAKDATQRKALTNHFDPDTIDSGLIYSGVEEALIGMSAFPGPAPASGLFNKLLPDAYWDPAQYINNPMYPPLSGDPFDYVTRQVKARISKLMASTIVSPLDTRKANTLDSLEKGCLLALPLALAMRSALLAEFCFLTQGLTEMAIGADDVLRDKPKGTERIIFGALNAMPVTIHGLTTQAASLNSLRRQLGKASRESNGNIKVSITTTGSTPATDEGWAPAKLPPPAPTGLQTVKINGDPFLTYSTPNEGGFFELFMTDPVLPGKIQATGLYAIQSADRRWRRVGLSGGGAFRNGWQRIYRFFGGPDHSTFFNAYEMPAPLRDAVANMMSDNNSFSADFEPLGSRQQALRDTRNLFFEKRGKLAQDSTEFFNNRTLSPLRPVLPTFSLDESQTSIIHKLFGASDGLVVGETHGAVSSKAFLVDNMQELARVGVKRIYFEHLLTDIHTPLLKLFYRSRSARMPDELKNYLKGIYPPLRDSYYTFQNIVIKAREAGIKVQPIDCTVSYMIRDMPDTAGTLRQRMMNFYATEVIQWIQTTKRHPGKWIAFVGDSHTNNYRGVPGLAELTGSIGLRIEDVRPGLQQGIMADPGQTSSMGIGRGEATVKANFVLRVDTASLRRPAQETPGPSHSLVLKTPETQLTKPAQFLLSAATPTTSAQILYRSRRGNIQTITINQTGALFSISVPGWSIDQKHFRSVQALVDALKARPGVEQVAG
ncbi:type III effector protein, HopAC1 family [Pseudomonas yamanorum]|uniref:membrane-targeted effector domain-containing toxin n=1 Tax=Pseudomonas yamanorum TaxID=515393 RepID=UPI00159FBF06|nr:membrane-targeted effector domain-containing toxin [Pseudomonas yamanorum]NVZ83880.1 type III effector protein, HopAC1 family [Pseudomonas yamanorum]